MKLRIVLLLLLLLFPSAFAKNKGQANLHKDSLANWTEVIVEFDGPALKGGSPGQLIQQLKNSLGQFKGRLKIQVAEGYWASQSFLVRLPEADIGRLLQIPGVRRVYRNQAVKLGTPVAQALATPSEQGNTWALERLGAPQLWALGLKGQGIRIGHLDTGVDGTHPELRRKIAAFAVIGEDGTPKPSNPYDSAEHGTFTAGLLVGNSVGMAPGAQLVSALVLPGGNGTLAQVLGGLDWVLEQNVQIVSMSLGLQGTWSEFAPVVERMKQMGVLPIFTIGNSGGETSSPANIPDVLGIGAVDANNQLAGFSSRSEVRWSEPYNVSVSKPDLVAPGVNVFSIAPGGRYMSMSGTSISTALTTGGAALLMSGGAKAEQVRQALLQTAQPLQAGSGKGLVRLVEASAALGYGKNLAQQPSPPQETQPSQPVQQTQTRDPAQKTALLVIETSGAEGTKKALENLGYKTEIVQSKPDSRPSLEKIASYSLMIWVLPTNWADNWPQAHRKMLRAWVEGGGRLLMITNNRGQRPVSESDSYGKGKAVFASGDFGSMAVEQRAKVFQGVIGNLMR